VTVVRKVVLLRRGIMTVKEKKKNTKKQRCGSGSGIRCLFDLWIRDPEPG
jgi:hypothetical protein